MRLCHLALALPALLASLPALALDPPARKPGLWDMKWGLPGQKGYAARHCIDAATDRDLGPFLVTASRVCSAPQLSQLGAELVVEWVCKTISTGEDEDRVRGIVTGSFDSAYTVALTTRSKNTAQGTVTITPSGPVYRSGPFDEEVRSTIEATWLGPCGPDLKPGDILWSDGKTTNIHNR